MSYSDELAKLADLHQRGVLSDEEFAAAKARVLSGSSAASATAGSSIPQPGALHALRRSQGDRWLGGVCGGIALATGVPSWVWRLIFVVAAVCAGTGVALYVLLWILMPQEPLYLPASNDSMRSR